MTHKKLTIEGRTPAEKLHHLANIETNGACLYIYNRETALEIEALMALVPGLTDRALIGPNSEIAPSAVKLVVLQATLAVALQQMGLEL